MSEASSSGFSEDLEKEPHSGTKIRSRTALQSFLWNHRTNRQGANFPQLRKSESAGWRSEGADQEMAIGFKSRSNTMASVLRGNSKSPDPTGLDRRVDPVDPIT